MKRVTEPPRTAMASPPTPTARYLTGALALIVAFLITEVVVGIIAGSLALISDAGHMLTDAASIVLALVAIRLSAKPAQGRWTYGYKRAEILSAQANGLSLLLLAIWFIYEAVRRLIDPPRWKGCWCSSPPWSASPSTSPPPG